MEFFETAELAIDHLYELCPRKKALRERYSKAEQAVLESQAQVQSSQIEVDTATARVNKVLLEVRDQAKERLADQQACLHDEETKLADATIAFEQLQQVGEVSPISAKWMYHDVGLRVFGV